MFADVFLDTGLAAVLAAVLDTGLNTPGVVVFFAEVPRMALETRWKKPGFSS
jgi:hypothetical protein